MRSAPVLVLSLLLATSCSSSMTGERSIDSVTGADQHNSLVVAQTIEDQAKSEIQNTPTQFFVSLEDDRPSWDRARIFFEKYLPRAASGAPVVSKVTGSRWALTNSSDTGLYLFEVWREPSGKGYRYTVQCSPRNKGGSQRVAMQNAQNVARFIKEGRLEISQITP